MRISRIIVATLMLILSGLGWAQQQPKPPKADPETEGKMDKPALATPNTPNNRGVEAENQRLRKENLLLNRKIQLLENRIRELEQK